MELFLNVCWVGLLLPAYLLWRRSASSRPWTRASFVIICTLGSALVMLFPIISASDDLHAVGQAMEESKRSVRHGAHCSCSSHAPVQRSLASLPAISHARVVLKQVGTVVPFSLGVNVSRIVFVSAGRSPPVSAVSL
ncbi:MAG TPA: hypothetical protein VL983_05650 [Terriglobales bacterium]|nr:hypothetical protein [Terriglobales bacterium]